MTFTAVGAIVIACWAVVGLGVSLAMRRRGHDLFAWLWLGAALGPLVIPLALDAVRREQLAAPRLVRHGAARSGLSVLVGFDGSAEARAALEDALALLGPSIGRLVIARVVDFDADAIPARARAAADDLAEAAAIADAWSPETVVLHGDPGRVLCQLAGADGHDLLVVGARGAGASAAILGSVTARAARHAPVPVLVVPARARHRTPAAARWEAAAPDAPGHAAAGPARVFAPAERSAGGGLSFGHGDPQQAH